MHVLRFSPTIRLVEGRSKDDLFDAVFHELVLDTVRETPLDATDLPGYAGRLFDGFEERPEVARLATWYRLERAEWITAPAPGSCA
jgi:hypothetical protein